MPPSETARKGWTSTDESALFSLEDLAEKLRKENKSFPARERSISITKIDEAILWLRELKREGS